MKKGFLLSLMVASSVAGYAQYNAAARQTKVTAKPVAMQKTQVAKMDNTAAKLATALPASKKVFTATPYAQKASRRTLDNGVYYDRPAGSYFLGWTEDWSYYYRWFLFVAPVDDNLLVNRCTTPEEAVWTLETAQDTYDLSDEVDEDNNLPWGGLGYNPAHDADNDGNTSVNGWNSFYVPTISVGDTSYTLGEDNNDDKGENHGAVLATAGRPQRMVKKLCTGAYSYFGDGNGGYGGDIYGTNAYADIDFDEDGVTENYRITGVFQYHEKPVKPMYVESVVLMGRPNAENDAPMVITEDHPIVMSFYNVVEDEEGRLTRGDSLMQQITCTQADITPVENNGETVGYNMVFANRTKDFFGMDVVEPFILDQAFCIVVTGFADEGNQVVITADERDEEVDDMYSDVATGLMMVDANGQPAPGYRYYRNVTLTPQFNAMFDCVKVYETLHGNDGTVYEGVNVITVPAEGGNTFEITPASDDENTVAIVETFLDWLDEEESENYFIEDLPDWISEFYYDESQRQASMAGDNVNPYTFIGFEVDPLPEGVDGRYAYVHITSLKGALSAPIIIKQGEVELPFSVQSVKAATAQNGAVYSLTGKRVTKAKKGLYIQNGKKFISK